MTNLREIGGSIVTMQKLSQVRVSMFICARPIPTLTGHTHEEDGDNFSSHNEKHVISHNRSMWGKQRTFEYVIEGKL